MSLEIFIRRATENDIPGLYRVAEDMEADNERHYFERCFEEQTLGNRLIFVAEANLRLVGYVQLIWEPLYSTFRRLGIPEIQDLNVIPEMRGRGLGGRLVDICEEAVRKEGKPEIGISVGLNQSFGPAQRLYVKKGYVPDGAGMCYDEVPVRPGEMRLTVFQRAASPDTLLTIKMIKEFDT